MKVRLRTKLLTFSLSLAMVPIVVAGYSVITLTRNELKSSINDELVMRASQVTDSIDTTYSDVWATPLQLMREALDGPNTSAQAKYDLLQSVKALPDVVALQLTVEGASQPLLIVSDSFNKELASAGVEPTSVLLQSSATLEAIAAGKSEQVTHLEEINAWLLTFVMPLKTPLVGGRSAVLSARVDLRGLGERIYRSIAKHDVVTVLDAAGNQIFATEKRQTSSSGAMREALALLKSGDRAVGVKPYVNDQGKRKLGGYAFTQRVQWIVFVERDEANAYMIVTRMFSELLTWFLMGCVAAAVGAMYFAHRISKPIVRMAKVATAVGDGNFDVQVEELRTSDEISDLGRRINEMTHGLRERERVKDLFGRYQSPEVLKNLLEGSDKLVLGGERRKISIMMTDLRGFTALSERLPPEQVVTMLNAYFEVMVDICIKHRGTIAEIIGDALLVLFGAPLRAPDHAARAVACAIEMQQAMAEVNRRNVARQLPELEMGIGLNTGEVVVGNIGSEKRMKYGVVGADVNLTARIESFTTGGQILVSESLRHEVGALLRVDDTLEVSAKGVKKLMRIFDVGGIGGDFGLFLDRSSENQQPLTGELKVSFEVLEGKHLEGEIRHGALLLLSTRSAVLRAAESMPKLANLKLNLAEPAELSSADIYAKVTRGPEKDNGSGGDHVVRFTAMTPEIRHHFELLIGPGKGA